MKSNSHRIEQYTEPPSRTESRNVGQFGGKNASTMYSMNAADKAAVTKLVARPNQKRVWTCLKNRFSTIKIEKNITAKPVRRAAATPRLPNWCVSNTIKEIPIAEQTPVIRALNCG